MKLLIEKNILLNYLTNVMRAISPRNIIPILNGVKFDLKKDGLTLIASDSDLIIKTFIPKSKIKKIIKEGSIVIQSKYLIEIIKKLPDNEINIEVIENLKIIITSENIIYNLNCLDVDTYPQINLDSIKNPIKLSCENFKKIINQTVFAISTQESRPILTGLNLRINGNILECIATDSYRLAKKRIVLDNNYDNYNLVIPGKYILDLEKLIETEANIEIHPFNNKILFKTENYIFQTALLNGSFPNVNNLIPTDFEIIIQTDLSNYYNAIDRASLLTQSKEKNIVKMDTNKTEILITSFASEIGKVEEKIMVESNNKNNISISFSAKYMLEALRVFEEEQLIILLNSDTKPIVLKTPKDESLIQLILPIKTY